MTKSFLAFVLVPFPYSEQSEARSILPVSVLFWQKVSIFCSVIVQRLYSFDLCIFAILLPYKLRRPTIVFLYLSNFVFVLAKNGKHQVGDGALAWRGRRLCKLEEKW